MSKRMCILRPRARASKEPWRAPGQARGFTGATRNGGRTNSQDKVEEPETAAAERQPTRSPTQRGCSERSRRVRGYALVRARLDSPPLLAHAQAPPRQSCSSTHRASMQGRAARASAPQEHSSTTTAPCRRGGTDTPIVRRTRSMAGAPSARRRSGRHGARWQTVCRALAFRK